MFVKVCQNYALDTKFITKNSCIHINPKYFISILKRLLVRRLEDISYLSRRFSFDSYDDHVGDVKDL